MQLAQEVGPVGVRLGSKRAIEGTRQRLADHGDEKLAIQTGKPPNDAGHVQEKPTTECHPFAFVLLSIATGIIASFGALALRSLIALFHNLLFLANFSFDYDASNHTLPSPWGDLVMFVPVVGAILVVHLVKNFAPEAKGHGVPEVMDAIYYNKGVIRPIVALIKALASAISIGSGGSVGREGPIVQIGSAFGSALGQLLRLPPWQMITLVASGAGAGIAATFNTPIGGLLFAAEIILHEVSVRTLVPVILATATATYLGQMFFGVHPAFEIPALETPYFHLADPVVLASYAFLGLALGLVSAICIRTVYRFEDSFESAIPNDYLRHMIGMLPVGVLFLLLQKFAGHYYIEGVGYATIRDVLSGAAYGAVFLLVLCLLKLLALSLTLGSGGSGGIFSPALFMGATFGGAYGLALKMLIPSLGISAPAYAVAGMAGIVGGVTGAALTAIVMIFEMTLDYSVILPITVTVAVSYGMRRIFCRESIYTMKLARRGHFMPEALRANIHGLKQAADLMDRRFIVLPSHMRLTDFCAVVREKSEVRWYLLENAGRLSGVLSREQGLAALIGADESAPLMALAATNWVMAEPETSLYTILSRLNNERARGALIASQRDEGITGILGVIGSDEIVRAFKDVSDLFPD